MVGTEKRDTIGALAGNDVALGRAGADRIDGGESRDLIRCGSGYDRYDIRSRGAGETSGNVYVAPSCEEEVDIPSTC